MDIRDLRIFHKGFGIRQVHNMQEIAYETLKKLVKFLPAALKSVSRLSLDLHLHPQKFLTGNKGIWSQTILNNVQELYTNCPSLSNFRLQRLNPQIYSASTPLHLLMV